jgi:hypothetical protein
MLALLRTGIVPNVVRDLFAEIGRELEQQQHVQMQMGPAAPKPKTFTVRLSMMEIYNEVSGDH